MSTVTCPLVDQVMEAYVQGFPEHVLEPERNIAEEIELPVTTKTGAAASFEPSFNDLASVGWEWLDQFTVAGLSFGPHAGFQVKPETTWSTAEVISPPFPTLWALRDRMVATISSLAAVGQYHGVRLLSYGMQPLTRARDLRWVPCRRYAALRAALKFTPISKMMVTASQQCHVLVSQHEAAAALNVLNGLSGVFTALCAHSPIGEGFVRRAKAVRERAYRTFPGDRVGILPWRFTDLEEVAAYVLQRRLLFFPSRGKFVSHKRSLKHLLENSDLSLTSAMKLVQLQEGTLWPVARLRWREKECCTIEVRCACPQLPGDHTVSALALGLIANLSEAVELFGRLSVPDCLELRRRAVIAGMAGLDRPFVERVIEIARVGLAGRRHGEEVFLDSARLRATRRWCPADEALEIYRHSGFAGLVTERSWRPR